MALRLNAGSQNAAGAAVVSDMTVLEVRTGSQPASGGTAASGTLLATITGITWAQGAAGVQQVSGTPTAQAVASGTAGWGRFRNPGDTKRMDGAIGSDFTLANTSITSGGDVTLTGASLTMPAATG